MRAPSWCLNIHAICNSVWSRPGEWQEAKPARIKKGSRQEREELRTRLELNEARTKKAEDLIAALEARLGDWRRELSDEEGSEIGRDREIRQRILTKNRWRKLEISIFSGDDALGWTQRLERYFSLREVSEDERMQATVVALEGRVLSLFQWWERCNSSPTWESFKLAVVRRFQPSMIQNPFELLLSLKQLSTVDVYVEEFERYAGAL